MEGDMSLDDERMIERLEGELKSCAAQLSAEREKVKRAREIMKESILALRWDQAIPQANITAFLIDTETETEAGPER
jgi:hypothetical protein